MADPVEVPAAVPTPSPTPADPAAAATPPSQPTEVAAAAPTPEPPAPAVEAPPAPEAPKHPVEVPSALEAFAKEQAEKPVETKPAEAEAKPAEKPAEAKPEEKPAEAKPPEVAKPAEAKPDEAPKPEEAKPAELPAVEYKYTLPEKLAMNDEQKVAVHSAFDAFRADPTNPQPLIDFHAQQMEAFGTHLVQEMRSQQNRDFNAMREEWRKELMADPEFGGAGYQTTMSNAARVRDVAVSDHKPGTPEFAKDLAEFDRALSMTGAGDNPTILKAFSRLSRFISEAKPLNTEIKPAPTNGVRPGSRSARMYDNTNFGPKG